VQQAGDGYLFRPITVVRVVGMHAGVKVYEIVAKSNEATDEQRRCVELSQQVFDCFTSGQPCDCLDAIDRLEALTGVTKLTKAYRAACEPYTEDGKASQMVREIVLSEK
jgi:hypothetical protein